MSTATAPFDWIDVLERPGSSTFRTHDVLEARSYVSGMFRSHALRPQTRRSALAFRHALLGTPRFGISLMAYGEPVEVTAPRLGDFTLLQLTMSGVCEVSYGADEIASPAGTMYAIDPERPFVKTWSADCSQLMVKIRRSDLQACLHRTLGPAPLPRLVFEPRAVPVGIAGAAVPALIGTLARLAVSAPTRTMAAVHSAAEEQLILALLGTLPNSCTDLLAGETPGVAPGSVVKVRRYIAEHLAESLTLEDLARAGGVGPRALQRAFMSTFRCSPLWYLREMRLLKAQSMLLDGRAGEQPSVTEVALSCGFTHLSRFADIYRRRFGELPSETARRPERSLVHSP